MMNKLLYIILIFGFTSNLTAQVQIESWEQKIIGHFEYQNWADTSSTISSDRLYTSPYKEKFELSISQNPIQLDTIHKIFVNPYFNEKWDKSEKKEQYIRNYLKSFSKIWNDNLITLFEKGKFHCIDLETLNRNRELEIKLNSKKIKYHWSYKEELYGYSTSLLFGGTFKWNGNRWKKINPRQPIKNQPIIFQDEQFVVFKDCFGEWGGTIYFYDKVTNRTYFTESTCANSVLKDTNGGYKVVAHLGHGEGSSEIKNIPDPTKLSFANSASIGETHNGQALGYNDKSKAFDISLDYYGITIFSGFEFQERTLFIVNLLELTFLAEIIDNKIEIVNPLFFDSFYAHEPVVKNYGDYILIKLDSYGTGLYREISALIIDENRVIKIDWNENHSR